MEEEAILKMIRTTDERNSFVNLVEKLQENIFKKTPDFKFLDTESESIRNISNIIHDTLAQKNILSNRTQTENFLESLLTKARNIETMKISIAFAPTPKLISDLKAWSNSNISGNIIFDITVDQKIQGGTIIINNEGEYLNYSLSERIDKVLINKRQEIISLL